MASSVSVGLSRFARLTLAVLIAVGTVSVLSGCPKKQVKKGEMSQEQIKQQMMQGSQGQTKSGKSSNPGMPGGTK